MGTVVGRGRREELKEELKIRKKECENKKNIVFKENFVNFYNNNKILLISCEFVYLVSLSILMSRSL